MVNTLAIDLTCLFIGPSSPNPRGIDRVELAYAWHFIDHWPGECVAVIPTPWGMRYFDRSRAKRGIIELEEIWREKTSPEDDGIYIQTKSFILTDKKEFAFATHPRAKPVLRQVIDFIRLLRRTGVTLGTSVRSLPKNAIYLNVGQLLFFRPWLSWLKRRPDVLGVFMIHDLIPLEYPEHHVPLGVKLHESIVRNASEFAGALIVPSQVVGDSLKQPFLPARLGSLATCVESLPVSPTFLKPTERDPELSHANYFIACGVIEAHKNHILLLEVWKELIELWGDSAPKLIIAGFSSVTSKPVFDFIESNPQLRSKVVISSGLSTAALRRLMMSAKALLMPSVAEGFGLPVVEALAQGTPVLASDIPALREAGRGGDVTYLSPRDRTGWRSVIEALAAGRLQPKEAFAYTPKQWANYFRGIEDFLGEIVAQ